MSNPFSQQAGGSSVAEADLAHPMGSAPSMPTVMLIDDSIAVRKVLEATFSRANIPLSAFENGLAAFGALARKEVPAPSLVLLDLGLPRMDGYEVATLLKGHKDLHDTIVIMLTAKDGMLDRVRARLVGAKGYITKPFRVADVVNIVCSHLNLPPPGGRSHGTQSGRL
jgi:DNA-binding response OmpR family regulator